MKKLFSFCLMIVFVMSVVTPVVANPPENSVIESEDINRDGKVNWIDWMVVVAAALYGKPAKGADINQDGWVDHLDIICVQEHPEFSWEELQKHEFALAMMFRTERMPGDVNDDGRCDSADNAIIGIHNEEAAEKAPPADQNNDGIIDKADLELIARHFFGLVYFERDAEMSVELSPAVTKEFVTETLNPHRSVCPQDKIVATWGAIKSRR